jgi:hypothetical protein
MNEILLKIIENMVSHFWIITLTIIGTSLVKKLLFVWFEWKKIQVQNKDCVRLSLNESGQILEIQSSNLKIDDLKKIKDDKVLEYTKAS